MAASQHYHAGQARELQSWIADQPREGKILYLNIQSEEAKEAEELDRMVRWMDRIGYTAAVVAGLLIAAVVVIQLAIRFGW